MKYRIDSDGRLYDELGRPLIGIFGERRTYHGPVDLEGFPVRKPKHSHPYDYDAFVRWRGGPNEAIDHAVYSDRLVQWDFGKVERLANEHMPGRTWWSASHNQIEAFLKAYFDDPELRLIVITEEANKATGHPVWCFHYQSAKYREPNWLIKAYEEKRLLTVVDDLNDAQKSRLQTINALIRAHLRGKTVNARKAYEAMRPKPEEEA